MSINSTRRYLSVWLRRLATDRIERRSSAPVEPLAVVAPIKSAQRIVALNDAAAGLGLSVGLAVADARARYPGLAVVEANFEADARLLEAIADWCDRYTPLIGLDPPDGLTLDIAGCAHLFGGEAAMVGDLVERLTQQGFQARAAVADTVGCASAMARYGDTELQEAADEFSDAVVIVPRSQTETAVLPLPVAALRLSPEIVADLAAMGLRHIGDLIARPRPPLAARFGEILLCRLDQALGLVDEPISPRLPLPVALVEQRFAAPIAREDDVLGTIEQLARQLAHVLERRGEGARLIGLALFRVDGKAHRLEIGTGAPLREPARVRKLFEDRLAALGDACDPGFGFDVVRLSALVTERVDPAQTGLAAPEHDEELAHLVDRLGARFGLRRISRLIEQDTHIPEFAVAAVPAHACRTNGATGFPPPTREARGGEGRSPKAVGAGGEPQVQFPPTPTLPHRSASLREGRGARESLHVDTEDAVAQDSLSPSRPLRLFARPEPVEAIAEVPDGPPVKFRWRHVMHQVTRAEGPERIAMEWWRNERGDKLTRDYFRIESQSGARVWLYREGLYGRETERPRWYLHGLFA
jgi:protein ImuB